MENRHPRFLITVFGGVICSLMVAAGIAQGQSFTGIGFLKGATEESQALSVSKGGTLVAGSAGYNEPLPSFHHQGSPVWWSSKGIGVGTLNTLATLPTTAPGGPGGQALAVSEEGNVIVGYSYIGDPTENGFNAVYWKKPFDPTKVERLETFTGYKYSRAVSSSRNGSRVAGYSMQTPSGSTPFRHGCYWDAPFPSAAKLLPEGVPGAVPETSWPTSISSSGKAIVGLIMIGAASTGMKRNPILWTWDKATNDFVAQLLPLPAGIDEGMANDVSISGAIIVGSWTKADGNFVPCRWVRTATGYEPHEIPNLPPGGATGTASALDEEGDIIVGYVSIVTSAGDYIPTAWIWSSANGTRTLADALAAEGVTAHKSWTSFLPMDISSDGHTIVGSGQDAKDEEEGWVATLQHP